MQLPALRKTIHQALSVLALVLTAAGAAQASYVVGTWDPPYGTPFTNLGWRGAVTLQAANACLVVPGVVVNNGGFCPLMTVVSATVEFYDTSGPPVTLETLDFTNDVMVTLLSVGAGNQADGFALASTGAVPGTHPLAMLGSTPISFALEVQFVPGQSEAVLRWGTASTGELLGRNDPRFPAYLRIATQPEPTGLPEPTTLALTGAALAALALARRRRARAGRPWPSPGTNSPQDCLCPGSA